MRGFKKKIIIIIKTNKMFYEGLFIIVIISFTSKTVIFKLNYKFSQKINTIS